MARSRWARSSLLPSHHLPNRTGGTLSLCVRMLSAVQNGGLRGFHLTPMMFGEALSALPIHPGDPPVLLSSAPACHPELSSNFRPAHAQSSGGSNMVLDPGVCPLRRPLRFSEKHPPL